MAKFNLAFNRQEDVVSGPNAWELFLLGAGVTENNCASLLTSRSDKARVIRTWVREHYSTRYVPEHILEALGLRRQLKVRWQGDE
jgi:hypothetical protein